MIHPTATVSEYAVIADDVTIGPYALVEPAVTIGAGCTIESHVLIRTGCQIGKNNHFYQFCSIGERGQHLQDRSANGQCTLVIGDNNVFREYCTIHKGLLSETQSTVIGSNNYISAYCHFAHDVVVGNHNQLGNDCQCAGHVHIGDYVTLGTGTLIHQFCRIGSDSQSGVGSVIIHDVPAFVCVSGESAKVRSVNTVGLKRRGFDLEQRSKIKRAFRMLYLDQSDVDVIREQCGGGEEIELFIQSISSSDRGMTGYRSTTQ